MIFKNQILFKIFFIFILFINTIFLFNNCGDNNSQKEDTFKVAIVMPGNKTDKSWNQSGYEGVVKAKNELGIEIAYSENVKQPDQIEAMADYARRGYNVVIGHGGEFQDAGEKVSSQHPKTLFAVTNGVRAGNNLATIAFNYKQFGYLLGYLGGKMSKTGKVGFIGAQQLKHYVDLAASFEEGFKKANSDGKVFITWTNDWDDIVRGKEAAINQINQGADVIFPTMDNATIGSLQAAKERNIWAFGIYYDAIQDWPGTVLQSAIFDISSAIVEFLTLAKEGKAEGKNYKYGVESPEVARLGSFHSSVPESIRKEVMDLFNKIESGQLNP